MPSYQTNHLFKKTSPDEQEYCLTFMEDYIKTGGNDSEYIKLLSVYHHELLLFYQFCKVSGFHSEIISKIARDAPMYDNIEDSSVAIDYWNDLLNAWD